MTQPPNFSAHLADKAAVYEVSGLAGYTQLRGSYKGNGSPRLMLEAIADGAAIVAKVASENDYALASDLRELAQDARPELADLLNRIAAGLEVAEKMWKRGHLS